MAIFTSTDQQSNAPIKGGAATIIAQGTKIKGDMHIDCHLHIDGDFEGNIYSKNTVMIGKTGNVLGNIFAQKLIVNGKFNGVAESSVVEILPTGRIEGRVITPEFVIERKGVFVGESKVMDKNKDREKEKVEK
ncbi:bactofilin family protein [Helicobacter anatolicus]|uniref:bactofilin family protein n=1 Tax=Helicobacter anatolicus TaxID=2905874 RepID=UPI001E4D2CE2|nr:polymer-forming cytoskeletal protein [Helicobacter anatolicus]MCE3036266.1 polymer-forming cytoskeletal protein [Helicobacter anatolicus]MCE3039319.1 polymer-forming cytoskeletal protein [Helicobacter anatolicus]